MALTRISGDMQDTYLYPLFCDSIDDFFDGSTTTFTLRVDSIPINNLVDSRNVQVYMNGFLLKPYIPSNNVAFPWDVGLIQKNGDYEIVGNKITFFMPPEMGEVTRIVIVNKNSYTRKTSNSFAPLSIALGD